eukprot:scaffold7799_cov363-Prasinococcus_capsulatus_cf.AAC.1
MNLCFELLDFRQQLSLLRSLAMCRGRGRQRVVHRPRQYRGPTLEDDVSIAMPARCAARSKA